MALTRLDKLGVHITGRWYTAPLTPALLPAQTTSALQISGYPHRYPQDLDIARSTRISGTNSPSMAHRRFISQPRLLV